MVAQFLETWSEGSNGVTFYEHVKFHLCARRGPIMLKAKERKIDNGHIYGRAFHSRVIRGHKACNWYSLRWVLPGSMFGIGWYDLRVWAVDSRNRASRSFQDHRYTVD